MGLNHSKPRLRKRRSASRSRRVRQNPDGVSSAVPSSQVNQSKFSPTSSLNECSNLVCQCKKQQDSEKNNEFAKSTADFAASPLRHRPNDVTKYVAITKPGCDGMDEMVGLKVQLPPCSDNDHFDLSSITDRDIHKILLQHNNNSSSNGKKKSSRRNKTSSSSSSHHHHHHHHRQSNAASAAADEYTLYFTDMGSSASRKELISRLTTSICGILDSRLEHLPNTKAAAESPSSAIRLRLSVLPQDTTACSDAEHKVAKNGDGVTTKRANDSDAPAFVRYYQRNDHRRSPGDVNCERQKHYHQIPGTDAVLQQPSGGTTRIDSSPPITSRCCHKKSSSTAAAATAVQADSSIPPPNQQRHRNESSDDWKPRYNLGIKRMSEAWRRRVSPSDEKFYEIVNSRLREWQKQEDPGRAKRKGADEGGGGVEAEVTTKSGVRGRTSTAAATYQLIWPDDDDSDDDDDDDDETFQNNPASSSDSEYDGGDRDDDVAKRRGTANGGVLRMYQPLSERDIEAISCMGKAACIEVGATQANNLVPPHPPHIIHDKQAKKRRHTFSFKRKPKAETAAHQSKEAADVPSASRHGYLRANSIDPGAPCPFPNTPGVTATPFALVPLSHKDIATSTTTATTIGGGGGGGMQPVSLVVQRHCHEYVHHHHYYYPAKQS